MSTVCKIDTELVIPASPEQVWAVFGDFSNWGQWNDFMVLPVPPKSVGKHCKVLFRLDEGCIRSSVHDPEIVVLKLTKELRWRDYRGYFYSLFFHGSHWWTLEALPNGHTRFVHGAEMMGFAIPFLSATMRATLNGYNRFNKALLEEVLLHNKRKVGRQTVV